VPRSIRDRALAYLVVVVEGRTSEGVQEDLELAGARSLELGALDVFVLPPQAGTDLIRAREQAFWVAKSAGADDIVDVVVPRAAMARYLREVGGIAQTHDTTILGCGHVGDGNLHLSVYQADRGKRAAALRAIYRLGVELGGAISGEHGIGSEKLKYWLELEAPAKIALRRRINAAFDPNGILNPGATLG
jgi:glycolate oxidase